MNKQKEILKKIADTHGINITQAEEIWKLLGNKIANVISSDHKTDGLFGGNLGDIQNNWIGRLQALYGQQSTSAKESSDPKFSKLI